MAGDLKFSDLRDEYSNMQWYTKILLDIYKETTTMSYTELVNLIQNEKYLSAEEFLCNRRFLPQCFQCGLLIFGHLVQ
jgi:ATP-dependent protease ClpP protease subunit